MYARMTVLAILSIALGSSIARAGLMTHIDVSQAGGEFSYTLFNDEPTNSPNFLSIWHLSVDAPILVTESPVGWDFFTDNATYIDWFNTDPTLPYPHDVAPGTSLSGFLIQTSVTTSSLQIYTIGSWDHVADTTGPDAQSVVLSPTGLAAVPEPATLTILSIGIAGLAGYRWLRRKQVLA